MNENTDFLNLFFGVSPARLSFEMLQKDLKTHLKQKETVCIQSYFFRILAKNLI